MVVLFGATSVLLPLAPAAAEPTELIVNGTLAEGRTVPTCFLSVGFGTHKTKVKMTNDVPAGSATGTRSYSINMTSHTSGDVKLIQDEAAGCAPTVSAGQSYDVSVDYKSTSDKNSITVFAHTADGWDYWKDLKTLPPSADWTTAQARIDNVPEGVDRLSFGVSLYGVGELKTTNYSLMEIPPPPPPPGDGELIVNGSLSAGSTVPTCFLSVGLGTHQTERTIDTDVPAGSATGTRSYSVNMTSHTSGDVKLIQDEAAGCAPTVSAGQSYDVSVDYKSTSDKNSITVFAHTADGWDYWKDLKTLPPSADWTTAQARIDNVPEGVDRLSFGVSLYGVGELKTTNYSLKQVALETPPGSQDPALIGSWEVLENPLPVRAIHSTLLEDGRLLLIAGSGNDGNDFAAGTFKAVVWNPGDNSFTDVPVPYDMFCAGHVTLPDGKVLLAGGTQAFPTGGEGPNAFEGSKFSYYFDPADNQFHPVTDMAGAHWYPSLTKLGNGDVWAAGGLNETGDGTTLTELFQYSSMSWLPQSSVPQTWSYWGTYPHMFLLDDGKMFYTGGHTFGNGLPGTGASIYDWKTAQIWDVPGLREKDMRDQAGSVFIGPAQDQRLMIVGGGNTDTNNPAINLVDIIDLNAPEPTFEPGPNLPGPGKLYVNLINLPDRTVLAANGAQYNRSGDVLTAAVYDPQTNNWLSINPDPTGRNYHSSSVLLPDGRVAVLGSNPADNSFELRISVYSPSYLHRGERPQITQAPETAGYGDILNLEVEGEVTAASLMAPMSSTHQTDTNARLIDLPLAGSGSSRTVQVPDNPNLVPPGPYMLTVLDADGVPSQAKWVRIS
ncbi:kelch motif-containing protein [uncultured Kocuria sp.]|uniref:kelch motif-containing protein n=1 Tax=uncultured Kocuria sp. TaxID=259305 RepID=UPI002619C3F7|nr:kelch motif-containing protein [uncultured Kocuria sp.]